MISLSTLDMFRLSPIVTRTSRNYSQFIGLPFKISRKQANDTILQNKRWFEESETVNKTSLIVYDDRVNIKECYIPFHGVDIKNLSSSFSGSIGRDRSEFYTYYVYNHKTKCNQPVIGVRTVTDWYDIPVSHLGPIDYPFGLQCTQVYAGFEYPKDEIKEALMTSSPSSVVDITTLKDSDLVDEKGNKRIVKPHEMTISYAIETIFLALHKNETERAMKYALKLHSADHVQIENLVIHLEKAKIVLKSYHYPAFIHSYHQNNIPLVKIVNGYNGSFGGEYALSTTKLFFFGGLIGFGAAIPFASAPAISTALFAGRLAAGSMIGGILSAIYARYRHVIRRNSSDKRHQERKSHNATFQPTDDDIKRQTTAEEFNEDMHHNSSRNHNNDSGSQEHIHNDSEKYQKERSRRTTIDQRTRECLILLGLPPNILPTKKELSHAYHLMIKKWHPDTYNGDKIFATNMTVKISEARVHLDKLT